MNSVFSTAEFQEDGFDSKLSNTVQNGGQQALSKEKQMLEPSGNLIEIDSELESAMMMIDASSEDLLSLDIESSFTNHDADQRRLYTTFVTNDANLTTQSGEQALRQQQPVPDQSLDFIDRKWPERAVTEDNIHISYVEFILCCNPSVPTNCDVSELSRVFNLPPKSDGNNFSTYKLFQLISMFEEGKIKTWTKLLSDLGVERRSDQSTQKVQQYAVRLKVCCLTDPVLVAEHG